MKATLAAVLFFLTLASSVACAAEATVVGVDDGDTLDVDLQGKTIKIRLYGIDAPEAGQQGNVSATRFLRHLVLKHPLTIKVLDTDMFGRMHAIVIRNGKESSVNAALVANGYAWVHAEQCWVEECRYWEKLEVQARRLKLGIWSRFDLIPPWEFGKQQRK
jgi:micrococcal nuclease